MKDNTFNELLESVREAGRVQRGEEMPARVTLEEDLDIPAIRHNMGLTQEQFSAVMGIKLATLRNWEQKRRKPESPARLLLRIAAKHPEIVMSVVQDSVIEVKSGLRKTATSRR